MSPMDLTPPPAFFPGNSVVVIVVMIITILVAIYVNAIVMPMFRFIAFQQNFYPPALALTYAKSLT